jgi:arabinogalactan endo-1,4-beta-galactosidase
MSTAVVPSGGSSDAFAQQGTVDWTRLSRSTVNFTVEILARLSKAGVEPLTVAMGQAIFSGFNLDPEGQKRFSDTISRLKAFSSYGNVMWFGFGVKHIVRTLSETE